MAKYAVFYDLIEGKDYQKLTDELERLGGVKTQFSVYLIALNWSDTQQTFGHFKKFVDSDDRLMVVKIADKPGWERALKGTNDWMNRNF